MDEATKRAARQLADRYGCSASEAIRRAVIRHRDSVFGVPLAARKERKKVLARLYDIFDGHDADDEIRRLKSEDQGF